MSLTASLRSFACGLCFLIGGISLAQSFPPPLAKAGIYSNGEILASAIEPDGKIIVAGNFTSVNDVPCANIARINPDGSVDSSWNPGTDINATIHALCVSYPYVYVGGNFQELGGQPCAYLGRVRLDGTGTLDAALFPDSALTVGPTNYIVSDGVDSIVVSGTAAYAAGDFNFVLNDGYLVNFLTRIDLNALAIDSTWPTYTDQPVRSLLLANAQGSPGPGVFQGGLFIGGDFENIYGEDQYGNITFNTNQSYLALLDPGTGESNLDWGQNFQANSLFGSAYVIDALATDGTSLFIGSNPGISYPPNNLTVYTAKIPLDTETVDPTWLPSVNCYVNSLTLKGGALLVGGLDVASGILGNAQAVSTSGSGATLWQVVPDQEVYSVGTDGTNFYAGGYFAQIDGSPSFSFARLKSATGSLDTAFNTCIQSAGGILAMATQSNGQVIIGGNFMMSGTLPAYGLCRTNTDGSLDTTWTPSSIPPAVGDFISIDALALNGTAVFAGGNFNSIQGKAVSNLAEFDTTGSGQLNMGWEPNPNGYVAALSYSSLGDLFVGGDFTQISGTPMNRLAQYSAAGTLNFAWTPSPNGTVNTLLASGTNLYVGGNFTTISGTNFAYLARIVATGTAAADLTWKPAPNSTILALATDGTSIYAGGNFTTSGTTISIGGQPRSYLAKLGITSGTADSQWAPKLPNAPASLFVQGNTLYIGGSEIAPSYGGLLSQDTTVAISTSGSGIANSDFCLESTGNLVPNAFAVSGDNLFVGFGSASEINGVNLGSLGCYPTIGAPTLLQTAYDMFSISPVSSLGIPYYQIVSIAEGALYLADGITQLEPGDFITAAEAAAGLYLSPGGSALIAEAVTDLENAAGAAGQILMSGSFTAPLAPVLTQTGLTSFTVAPDPSNSGSVTNFQIQYVSGPGLKTSGGQSLSTGSLITAAQGAAGLNFVPGGTVTAVAATGTTTAQIGSASSSISLPADSGGPIVNSGTAVAIVGVPFFYQIPAGGFPTAYFATGLPSGLVVNGTSGIISGTCTVTGTYTVGLTGSNSNGTGTAELLLTVVPTTLEGAGLYTNGYVFASAIEPDGKIIIGGNFSAVDGVPCANIARINPDGSVDSSWNPGTDPNAYVHALCVSYPYVYVGGNFQQLGGQPCAYLGRVRLDGTGALDAALFPDSALTVGPANYTVNDGVDSIVVSGTAAYVAGDFNFVLDDGYLVNFLSRIDLNALTIDSTWPTYTDLPVRSLLLVNGLDGLGLSGFGFYSNEGLFIGGDFQNIYGEDPYGNLQYSTEQPYLALLDPDAGEVDLNWNPGFQSVSFFPGGGGSYVIDALATDGTNLFFGSQTGVGISTVNPQTIYLGKLSIADATLDPNWVPSADVQMASVTQLAVSGSTLYMASPYSASYPGIAAAISTGGAGTTMWQATPDGPVNTIATDGTNFYIGGEFTQLDGHAALAFASLNIASGAPISGFTGYAQYPGAVTVMAVQPNGGVVVGGNFLTSGTTLCYSLCRFNADGSYDSTWAPSPVPPPLGGYIDINALALDGSSMVYAGGEFSNIQGQNITNLARFSQSGVGVMDSTWRPNPNDHIYALVISGSNLYAGGYFTSIGNQSRQHLAKIGSNGAADATWKPDPNSPITALLLSGTELYAGGSFSTISGTTANNLARLSLTGSGAVDTTWNPNANGSVGALATDGTSIYAGGFFTVIGGTSHNFLAKLSMSTGLMDSQWTLAATAGVTSLYLQGTTLYVNGQTSSLGNGSVDDDFIEVNTSGPGTVDASFDLQSPVDYGITAFAVSGGNLFIGFNYGSEINNNPIAGVAYFPSFPAPTFTQTSDDTFIINPDAGHADTIEYFHILTVLNGSLYLGDGVTPVEPGEYISTEEGESGLVMTPGATVLVDEALTDDGYAEGVAGSFTMSTNLVVPLAPVITQTSGTSFTVTPNAGNPSGITNFEVQFVSEAGLKTSDGENLAEGEYITTAQGAAGINFVAGGTVSFLAATGVTAAQTGTAAAILTLAGAGQAPVITSATSAAAITGASFSYQINATPTPTSYGATPLPANLTVNSSSGLISGTCQTSGTFSIGLSAVNTSGTGTATLRLVVTPPAPVITSSATATATAGLAFNYQIGASNTPTSYSAAGLPAGLALNAGNGQISGTVTQTGQFQILLGASNAGGTGYAYLNLTILPQAPVITSAATASVVRGQGFTYQITATNSPASFLASGLPTGIGYSASTGLVSGTPTVSGTFGATISAVNTGGTGTGSLTIYVEPPAPVISGSLAATGTTGIAFSYQINASNSPTGYSASGLPTGLTVNTGNGLISGTPTQLGSFSVYLGAANGGGSDNAFLTLTIVPPTPVINSAGTATGALSTAFSYQITATNSPTSFNATGLPGGLGINQSTGAITGTPTATGTTTVALSAGNAGGTGTASLIITVTPQPPAITSATTATALENSAFTYQIAATNSPASFSASGLPTGLGYSASTGLVSGTPTVTGTFSATIYAVNTGGTGSGSLTITVEPPAPVISGSLAATGTTGSAFSYQINASNSPTSYSASGLPGGLSVNTGNGLISGTPTQLGSFSVYLGAANATGSVNAFLTLTIVPPTPVINSAGTATGVLNAPFAFQVTATNSPTGFGAIGLPGGLTINPSTGVISGTPTATGTTTANLSASNAGGTGTANLIITVNPPAPAINSQSLANGAVGAAFTYQITASNSPTSFGATGLPGGLAVAANSGLISGTPSVSGDFTVIISAANTSGTGSAFLSLNVSPPAVAAPVITSSGSANAIVNTAFNYQITASNSPTSYGATNLPGGLAVNGVSGLISGSCQTTGTFLIGLSAANTSGTGTATLDLVVLPQAPVILSSATATATAGLAFNYQISASNTATSYSATGLPAGLSLNTGSGQITGTAAQSGQFQILLGAANAGGTGNAYLNLTVLPPAPVINSQTTATTVNGQAFTYQITASNSPTSFAASGLPTGLGYSASTGLISGTPTVTGTFPATISAVNTGGTGTGSLTIYVEPPAPVITGSLVATGTTGSAFSYQISATNTPTGYSASGLPTGLSVNTGNGLISGTPTQLGSFSVYLGAANGGGSVNAFLTLTIVPPTPVINSAGTATGALSTPFSYQITATNSPTNFNAIGLPGGLGINQSTGAITGTPTSTGTATVALSAGNAGGTGTSSLIITINPPPPVITSAGAASTTENSPFAYQITATNSPTGFNATNLPAGLTVTGSTGLISGTATVTGTFSVALTASNIAGTGSGTLLLVVNPPAPSITSLASANGAVGAAFTYQITASNSPTSFGAAGLPGGLSVTASNGLISGTPTASGNFTVYLTAANASGTGGAFLSLDVSATAAVTPGINSPGSASGTVNSSFNYQITATNSPTSYGASGLPPGVTVNTSNGDISGTPTTSGTYTASISASNSGGTGTGSVTIVITALTPGITSASSATGTKGVSFSYQITASNTPTSYSVSGLPTGLTYNSSTGLISGTPTQSGTFTVSLGAINSGGTGTETLTLIINPPPPVVTSGTTSGVQGTAFSFQVTATNSPTAYSATGLPSGLSIGSSTGMISGTPVQSGDFSVIVGAANTGGTGTAFLALSISPPVPVITSTGAAGGIVNTSFIYQVSASNDPVSYTASNLPGGLSINTSTGLISGLPSTSGTFSSTIGATNPAGTGTAGLLITIKPGVPVITSTSVANVAYGAGFSFQVVATNSPTGYSALGLPTGIGINAGTGLISGTVMQSGSFGVYLTATNSSGAGTAYLTINVTPPAPVITSATNATVYLNLPFSYQITASNSPTRFGATGLPAGLSVNTSTGLISGTATTSGAVGATITAANASGTGSAILALTLIGNVAPVLDGSAAISLPTIQQGIADAQNTGQTVANLLSGVVTDTVMPAANVGMAVIGVNNAAGTWEYDPNGGANWLPFGAASNSSAVLLLPLATVRFVPASTYYGTVNPGLSFRAWDRTTGVSGGTADATTNGGSTSFSAATQNATITVTQKPVPGLIISGLVNGPLSGGTPSAIELYVTANIPDLSQYGLGSESNGSGLPAQQFTFPAVAAQKGTFIYVAYEGSNTGSFKTFFGLTASYLNSVAALNGGSSVALYFGGSVVDLFGNVNASGKGQAWDYTNGWAYRKDLDTDDNGSFSITDWTYSGAGALTGLTSNSAASDPFPSGIFVATTTNVPPVINAQTLSVLTNAATGTLVGNVAASDPENGTLTYSITGGNTAGIFAINPASGAITVADAASLAAATGAQIALTVTVTNNGVPPFSSSATVTVYLINAAGSPTPSALPSLTFSPGANVNAIALLSNGQVAIGGAFSTVNGQTCSNFALINTDGSLSSTWEPQFDGPVYALAVNGPLIYAGGAFTHVGTASAPYLVRLNTSLTDGPDTTWTPQAPNLPVRALALANGLLYAGGDFTVTGTQSRMSLAAFDTVAGALQTWNPAANGSVTALLADATEIYAGGLFTSIGGVTQNYLARITGTGGAVDSWNPAITGSGVGALASDANGIYVGGQFTSIGGQVENAVARLSRVNAAADTTWQAAAGAGARVEAISSGTDGIYIGGTFNSMGGMARMDLARLSALSGSADATWNPSPNGAVDAIAASGIDTFVGGVFTTIGGQLEENFAFFADAEAPVMTHDPETGLVFISPNADNGYEIAYFQITGIVGGTLYQSDGQTPIFIGSYITAAQGAAGLVYQPNTNGTVHTITAVSAISNVAAGTGVDATTLNLDITQPVLSFNTADYSVNEGAGFVTITVQNNTSNAASVSYFTSDGSALAGTDYIAASGVLTFGTGATSQTFSVPIIQRSQYEGDRTFVISLADPGSGDQIGNPGVATVDIVDDNIPGSTASLLTQTAPDSAPVSTGQIQMNLTPSTADGQWRLTGEAVWHDSGYTLTGLTTGNYTVEFKPVNGYIEPADIVEPVLAGSLLQDTGTYSQTSTPLTGSLTVVIQPQAIATGTGGTAGQWQLQGDTTWHNSGDVISSLNAGNYTIVFSNVPGVVTPSEQFVQVAANQLNSIAGTYFVADPTTGAAPSLLNFAAVTGSAPYEYEGQVQTDAGFGTGTVVTPHAVLTAAHVLFDDGTLSYVTGVTWLFEKYAGSYEPVPQQPRGWYVFDGYAAQRAVDNSPGISSPQSQNLDCATMYFLSPPGRNGASGYVESDATPNAWLESGSNMILAGYPVTGIDSGDVGMMFSVGPMPMTFTNPYYEVYATTSVHGYPGMSGSPLMVSADNGNYYPAGVYLGGSGQTLVRAIDKQVVDLINRAEVSGNGGGNATGGGITPVTSGASASQFAPGYVKVSFAPGSVAVAGGWRISGETSYNAESAQESLKPGSYTVQFQPVAGFITPASTTVQVTSQQTATIVATYQTLEPEVTSPLEETVLFGQPFNYQIKGSNNPQSYVATGLPTGLSVNTSTGLISGTATVSGSFGIMLGVVNASGSGTSTLELGIIPAITSSLTESLMQGQAFSYQVTANAPTTGYGASGLPSGLVLNPATGLISGTATVAGVFPVLLSAGNAGGADVVTLTMDIAPVITSATAVGLNDGEAATYQIVASDTVISYSATGLPPGLNLGSNGLISGTPTSSGVYIATVTVTAAGGTTSTTVEFNIAPSITSPNAASGSQGQSFIYQITASDPVNGFNAVGLPAGLTVSTQSGIISGTPTVYGTFAPIISASNAGGTGYADLQITINPVITSPASAAVTQGQSFSYSITASFVATSYTATNLPPGLTFNASTGVISGAPTQAGTFVVPITATKGSVTVSGAVTIIVTLATTSAATASGIEGQILLYQITGTGPISGYTASDLPAGLSLDPSTGLISGTPTVYGVFTASIGIVSSGGASGSSPLQITIAPAITSPQTASVTRGQVLVYQISATNSPTVYTSGTLPAGLKLNTLSGVISGTAATSGQFSVGIAAINETSTASTTLTINITPLITSAPTVTGTLDAAFSYQIIPSDPVTSYGASNLPAGLTLNPATGVISGTATAAGTFTATISAGNAGGIANSALQIVIEPLLNVTVNGSGKITPGFAGITPRTFGQSYTIAATPSKGYYFSGWTGSISSLSPNLTFLMNDNLLLQANFEQFVPEKGTYYGLIDGTSASASGYSSFSLNPTGSFSAQIYFGGITYHVAGKFDASGHFSGSLKQSGELPITFTLGLDAADGIITGTFYLNGSVLSTLALDRNSVTGSATQAGYYTILLPPNEAEPADAAPPGYGFGTVTVASNGGIRFAGQLADGTKVSQGTALNAQGEWPFYLAPYKSGGSLGGLLTFETITGQSDIDGAVTWYKFASGSQAYYPAGYDYTGTAIGSRFTTLPNTSVLNFTDGVVGFADGNLGKTPASQTVTLNSQNQLTITGNSKFKMALSAKTGLFSGTFPDPVTNKPRHFYGALFQDQNLGEGFFLGNQQGGSVSFTAAP